MRNRLVAIFACLLLANVVNYALGEWLTDSMAALSPETITTDGSSFTASRLLLATDTLPPPTAPPAATLRAYYQWVSQGGAENYQQWRTASGQLNGTDDAFLHRALGVAESVNASRFLSLLLLIVTGLLLWGSVFRENAPWTPLLHFCLTTACAALAGGLSSPFFTALMGGSFLLYFGGIRLFLPIYHTEWVRSMRPLLTLLLFFLGTMALRGPELIEYWFWTSPLYRLGLTFVLLMTVFFHFSILLRVLAKAKLEAITRMFSLGMPLGFWLGIIGLVLSSVSNYPLSDSVPVPQPLSGIAWLNYELTAFPPAYLLQLPENAPYFLTGVGVLLAIISGVGYFIQRIAR